MRNFIIFLVTLICAFAYIEIHNFHDKPRVFRIATECDYTLHNWEEKEPTESNVPLANVEGRYAEGYDIQIAKLVAESIGATLEVKKIPWQELADTLNRCEVDAIFSGMLDTSARRKVMSFSDVYDVQTSVYGVMVRKNGKYADAEQLSDFIGASFVAQKDSNLDKAIAQIKGAIHLPPVMHVSEVFEKLIQGEADATVLDLDSAETYKRVYPGFKIIKFEEGKGFKFDFTGICAGVRKSDTKLLNEINDALKGISKHDRQKIMDQTVSRSWENI